jgi:hypothetical protein
MDNAILFINNSYISNWDELEKLIILSFGSQSGQFRYVQQEILSSVRDGNLYDWSVLHNLTFSHELDPDNFIKMTDGELQKFLLNLCGEELNTGYRPTFENHLEIVSEYKVIENDKQNSYPIKTSIPRSKSQDRKLKIGLRVINPVNDRIDVALVKHKKADVISWSKLKKLFSIDLREKGFIHYISIDITGLKMCEYVSLYADGKFIQTFKSSPGYIDLGVGPKWAICNLGAERSTEGGDEFAWGEPTPHERLNIDDTLKEIEEIHLLDQNHEHHDDAATLILGQNWRTPTREDWENLFNNCDVSYCEIEGVPCWKFTSIINDNFIVFPIERHCNGAEVFRGSYLLQRGYGITGFSGCYWSSTAHSRFYSFAVDNVGRAKDKYEKLMIRPVYNEVQ